MPGPCSGYIAFPDIDLMIWTARAESRDCREGLAARIESSQEIAESPVSGQRQRVDGTAGPERRLNRHGGNAAGDAGKRRGNHVRRDEVHQGNH